MLGKVVEHMRRDTKESLEGQIIQYIEEKKKKKARDKLTWDGWYRISSIPYMCPREEVHYALSDKIQYGDDRPAKLDITFNFGNAFQDVARDDYIIPLGQLLGNWECQRCEELYPTEEYVKKPMVPCKCGAERWKYKEVELRMDKYRIKGHPDGILNKGCTYKLLEIKTSNANSFRMFKKMKYNAPYAHKYILQVQMYMWILKYEEAIFLFFNKDNSDMLSLPVNYNYEIVKHGLSIVNKVRRGIRDKELPNCTCDDEIHKELKI